MSRMHLAAGVCLAVLLAPGTTACGTPRPDEPGPVVRTVVAGPPSPAAPAQADAGRLAGRLATAGVGVTSVAVQDPDSDPNHLLGRPGGYTSRASFVLSCANKAGDPLTVDAGGVIEVFADVAGAGRRKSYIGAIAQDAPELATEYDYQHGPVLLRIAAACPPKTAAQVDQALGRLTAG